MILMLLQTLLFFTLVSNCSLLLYRNTLDIFMLTFYLLTLPKSLISFSSFFGIFCRVFYVDNHSANKDKPLQLPLTPSSTLNSYYKLPHFFCHVLSWHKALFFTFVWKHFPTLFTKWMLIHASDRRSREVFCRPILHVILFVMIFH